MLVISLNYNAYADCILIEDEDSVSRVSNNITQDDCRESFKGNGNCIVKSYQRDKKRLNK